MNVPSSARHLAGNRALSAQVLANGVSAIGDWLYLTAIPILVFRETGDLALVGAAMAARLLPWFLLSIPAGIVADRVPRAALLLAAEATRATLMLLMTALLLLDAPLSIVFALALGAVAAGTFAMPAQGSLIPDLARNDAELGVANVVSSTFDNIACVVGPAIAGLLIVIGGLDVAFAINGLSFVAVVAVLIALVRALPTNEPPTVKIDELPRSTTDSWTVIARDAFRPLAMDAAISFAAGATFILPTMLGSTVSGDGDAMIGMLSTSAGLGGLAGAVSAGKFVNGRPRQGLVIGTIVAVASLGLLAASTVPLVVAASVAIVAGAITQLDTLNMTLLQRSTDFRRLGRTLGLLHTLASAWVMAGSIASGLLASMFGIGTAVIACTAVIAVLGAIALVRRPTAPERVPALASASIA